MSDLHALLQAHVAAATRPPFDGVVRRVQRRRRRQVVLGTLGVVLVVAGSAFAVDRGSPKRTDNVPTTSTAPPTLVVDGIALKRDKLLSFDTALATARTDHSLVLLAGTRPVHPDGCHPWSSEAAA